MLELGLMMEIGHVLQHALLTRSTNQLMLVVFVLVFAILVIIQITMIYV